MIIIYLLFYFMIFQILILIFLFASISHSALEHRVKQDDTDDDEHSEEARLISTEFAICSKITKRTTITINRKIADMIQQVGKVN